MSRQFLCSNFGVRKRRDAVRAKILAMVISVAMIVTMIPSMAFAATTASESVNGSSISDLRAALALSDDVILSRDIVVDANMDLSDIPNIENKTVWLREKSFDITNRNAVVNFGGLTLDGTDVVGAKGFGGIKSFAAGSNSNTDKLRISNVTLINIVGGNDQGVLYLGKNNPAQWLDAELTDIAVTDCIGTTIIQLHGNCTLNTVTVENCISSSGNQASAMIKQNVDKENASFTLTLNDCLIQNNEIQGGVRSNSYGAGVASWGDLIINRSVITDNTNTASNGGGVFAAGNIFIEDSDISDNEAAGKGGGVYAYNYPREATPPSSVTIKNSTISGNEANEGGGVCVEGGGSIVVEDEATVISGNTSTSDPDNGDTVPPITWNITLDKDALDGAIDNAKAANDGAISNLETARSAAGAIDASKLSPTQSAVFNDYEAAIAAIVTAQTDLDNAINSGLEIMSKTYPEITQSDIDAAKDAIGAKIIALQSALDALRSAQIALDNALKDGLVTTPTGGALDVSKPNVQKIRTPLKTIYVKAKDKKAIALPYVLDTVGGKPIQDLGLTVTSSNEKIVKVTKNGATVKINGVKTGKATITIKAQNGKTAKIKVVVVKKALKLKKFNVKAPKKLKVGKSYQLKISKRTKKATSIYKIQFKSSNKKILTVDAAGKVTALKKGKVKVTITLGTKKVVKTITVK